jgi:UDP-glucose:tetrahydrobiopterin glucosyltransferase
MTALSDKLKLLMLSSALGPLGSGQGGGVELKVRNLAREMKRRGHDVTVVAPVGSRLPGVSLVEIDGAFQTNAYALGRQSPITMPADPAQANIVAYAWDVQADYDLIVNFAYEWLPLYLTGFFSTPMAHFISLPSLMDFMDEIIHTTAVAYPDSIGVNTRAQAETFSAADYCRVVGSGIDLALYRFNPEPKKCLAWVGRITPEKGLEDSVAVANHTQIPLKVFGVIQDKTYWDNVRASFPDAPVEYMGFLPTEQLQEQLGQCQALLMTHRWVEAFGNVAIEALACGVPVVAYRRGGPAEIIRHGETGWLVEPDNVEGAIAAVVNMEQIDRSACRLQVEQEYTLEIQGERYEQWFRDAILPPRQTGEGAAIPQIQLADQP